MPQVSELIVGIDLDSKQAQQDLLALERSLEQAARGSTSAGKRMDAGVTKSTAKLRAEYERQRAVLDRNVIGLDRLDGGYKKNARAIDQMERQAKEARATLEKLFRAGAIDAKKFDQQLTILDDSMGEFRRAAAPPSGGRSPAQQFGSLALKIGGAVVAYKALSTAARSATRFVLGSVEAAQVQEDAENALAAAIERTGDASAGLQERLQAQASALQANSRFGDETLIRMQALGLSMGVGAGQIEKATQAAADMSAALGMDLQSAMRNVAKTTGGYAGELGELIPELKDLTKEQLQAGEGIDLLARKFGGAAARDVQTFSGRVDQLKNAWGDAQEQFGEAITDNEDLKTAMGNLAAILPGLGTRLAALAGELAPAAARAVELADGIIGIVTASNEVDTSNLQGISAELGEVRQEVIDLEDQLRGLREAARQRSGGGGGLVGDIGGSVRPGVVDEVVLKLEAARKKEAELREELVRTRGERKKAAEEAVEQARKEAESRRKTEREVRRQAQVQEELAKAQKAAAEAARRQREEIEGVTAQATRYADLAEQVESVKDTTVEQLALLETLAKGAESAAQSLQGLWLDGKLTAEEYRAKLAEVAAEQERIAQQQEELAAGAMSRAQAAIAGLGDPETKRTEGGALGTYDEETGEGGFQGFAGGELEMAGEAERIQAEALAELVMKYGEVGLAREQLAIEQEEAILRADMERMAIDGITAAEEAQIQARLQLIAVHKQEAQAAAQIKSAKKATTVATLQSAKATIGAAASTVAALTKSSKAQMAIEATQNVIGGITESAKAYAAFASYDFWAGAQHTLAATTHFAAAAQAGKGGGGSAPSGGGGGGGGGAPRDTPAIDTYREVREGDREERGPRYEVAITGTLLGGQPQDMARQISSYLSQFNEETDGRSDPVRG